MAKTLFAHADTALHRFEISDISGGTHTAFTFVVASWEVKYQAQDAYTPGIVPSTCRISALIGAEDSITGALRGLLQDSDGKFVIEILQGINVLWRGFLTPDLGSIEVRNGQRFVSLVASDGFGMLDLSTNTLNHGGAFAGVVPFTDQIGDLFSTFGFWDLFPGFLVSDTLTANSLDGNYPMPTDRDALYYSGSLASGLYYELDGTQRNFRTVRDVLNDILTTFGLRLYQSRGVLCFRTLWLDEVTNWQAYDFQGTFLGKISFTDTDTITPLTEGVELYKPAIREYDIVHTTTPDILIYQQLGVARDVNDKILGTVFPTGANHLNYWLDIAARMTVPGLTNENMTFQVVYKIKFGAYYWNGAVWTTTVSTITTNFNQVVQNFGPDPELQTLTQQIANSTSTADLPNIGPQTLTFDVDLYQMSGTDVDPGKECTFKFEYHGTNGNNILYTVNNAARKIGVDVEAQTSIGEVYHSTTLSAVPKELRYYDNTNRLFDKQNPVWGTERWPLIYANYKRITDRQIRPTQYYEIDINEELNSYSTQITWDGVEYFVINMSYDDRGTSLTLVEKI